MADEPCPRSRDVDRHDADLREIRRDYVTEKLFLTTVGAVIDRVGRLEQADTTKATGTRTWVLGVAQMVLGVALSAIATLLITRGH